MGQRGEGQQQESAFICHDAIELSPPSRLLLPYLLPPMSLHHHGSHCCGHGRFCLTLSPALTVK
eukprot:766272-Hanusia_phi.AAC.8